jgi:hypothetical protein
LRYLAAQSIYINYPIILSPIFLSRRCALCRRLSAKTNFSKSPSPIKSY